MFGTATVPGSTLKRNTRRLTCEGSVLRFYPRRQLPPLRSCCRHRPAHSWERLQTRRPRSRTYPKTIAPGIGDTIVGSSSSFIGDITCTGIIDGSFSSVDTTIGHTLRMATVADIADA